MIHTFQLTTNLTIEKAEQFNANHNSVESLATFVRLLAQKVTRLRSLIDGSCYTIPSTLAKEIQ
jgi:hypothetical protein